MPAHKFPNGLMPWVVCPMACTLVSYTALPHPSPVPRPLGHGPTVLSQTRLDMRR